MQHRLSHTVVMAVTTAVAVGAVTVGGAEVARAATDCQVDYAVTTQWEGGYTAHVAVHNLGDPLSGWELNWSFPVGQQVIHGWNADFHQSGSQVTAANLDWNRNLGAGASVTIGFTGSWTGSNPAPTSFTLNGVACTSAGASPTVTTPAPPSTATPVPPTLSPSDTPTPVGTPTVPPAAYPLPGRVTGSVGAHDPTMVRRPDGSYLLATTGPGITLKTSTDRIAFRDIGRVWPDGAPWTTPYTGGDLNLWAPDLSYHNGKYYLYYSASSFGSQESAIFLATSTTGAAGSWTHAGLVISSRHGDSYNAIDPNLVLDEQGRWWLSFGSFWTGIKLIQLDQDTGLRSSTDRTVHSLAARPGSTAIEAPVIFRHGGYYYLFVAFDLCCRGADSTYRIMVGRSSSVTGPYLDRDGVRMSDGGGTQILARHGDIIGPGHPAVLADVDGTLLLYHYYTPTGAAQLGINLLGFDSVGWPFVY